MMEWEEHLREMAQTADEHPEYKMMAWFTARDAVAEIDRLRAEIDRLRAELKGREEEVEKLTHERDLWENMAAMRLADQEAIERHTQQMVGELVGMVERLEEVVAQYADKDNWGYYDDSGCEKGNGKYTDACFLGIEPAQAALRHGQRRGNES